MLPDAGDEILGREIKQVFAVNDNSSLFNMGLIRLEIFQVKAGIIARGGAVRILLVKHITTELAIRADGRLGRGGVASSLILLNNVIDRSLGRPNTQNFLISNFHGSEHLDGRKSQFSFKKKLEKQLFYVTQKCYKK
uniref:Uncharacterized protein n=1 Tax=Cacopsylla melanoneura TaxID=428564 RepID=A0A8D8M6U7_9HEMI